MSSLDGAIQSSVDCLSAMTFLPNSSTTYIPSRCMVSANSATVKLSVNPANEFHGLTSYGFLIIMAECILELKSHFIANDTFFASSDITVLGFNQAFWLNLLL